MDKGLYDDDEEIIEATHYRLSRKVLPRITDEGYIEYGLQIPHNYQTRAANNAVDSRNSRNTNSNKKSSSDFGPDVNWILRGSGSVSRGSAGSLNHSLGVNGASGQREPLVKGTLWSMEPLVKGTLWSKNLWST